jgi:GTP pyrophosphokinase
MFTSWFLQFLKEQAALSAEEITADTVKNFISDLDDDDCEDDSYSSSDTCATIPNGKPLGTSNGDPFLRYSYQSDVPSLKTNGATNGAALKLAEDLVSKIMGGSGFAKFKVRYIQDEARAGLEAWQTDRIALWHTSGGGSVQWFSVCCHDRNSNLPHLIIPLRCKYLNPYLPQLDDCVHKY